ncbi:flagellar hook-length control protein FliK [Brenneria roseae]|nr:flagellar hook-length control protein FliK [Brenneria roseae]
MNLSTVTMITTNDNQRIEKSVVNGGIPDLPVQEQNFDQVLASTLTNSQKTALKEETTPEKNQSDNATPQNLDTTQAIDDADQTLQEVASENISFHKTKKSSSDETSDFSNADGVISFVAADLPTEQQIILPPDINPTVSADDQNLSAADEATRLLVSLIQASQSTGNTPVSTASGTVANETSVKNELATPSPILTALTQATTASTASTDESDLLSDDNTQNTLSSAATTSQSKSSFSSRSLSEQNETVADLKTRAQAIHQETSRRDESGASSFTPANQRDGLSASTQSLSAINVAVQQPVSVSAQTPVIQTSASIAPMVTAQINAQLGSGEWQQAISQQVIMFTRNGQQNAELRLHPQELGALQISLKLDDNQAHLHLVSANSQVRAAMEAALPHLRTSMAENGINLGQASVGSDTSPGWQQQAQQQSQNSHTAEQNILNDANGTQSSPIAPASVIASAGPLSGRVDIFA